MNKTRLLKGVASHDIITMLCRIMEKTPIKTNWLSVHTLIEKGGR